MDLKKEYLIKGNNFNLIRIYLSLSVVFFHCYELSGELTLNFLTKYFNGEMAVQAFFIISGYLIMKSYHRSISVKEYFFKRLLRIYPAYVAVILLCAILGCFVTALSIPQYFTSPSLYKYLGANLLFLNFLQPALPGVFLNNLFTTVNGSLWTLKIEVAYYILVPIIVFLQKRINVHFLYGVLFFFSVIYFLFFKHFAVTLNNDLYLFLSRQIPGQLFYFIIGAWVCELEEKRWFFYFIKWAGIPAIVLLFFPLPIAFQCLLMAINVFFIANIVPTIKNPYRQHDISYGVYIFHFPVIQVLVFYGVFKSAPLSSVVYALIATIILSIICWLTIERPFILKKTKYQSI